MSYKESRQLRGEQRLSCDQEYGVCSEDVSCQPSVALQGSGHGEFCTDEVQNCGSSSGCEGEAKVDCQWREWNSWPSCSVTYGEGQYNRSVFRDGEEAKTSFLVYFGKRPQHVRLHQQRGD